MLVKTIQPPGNVSSFDYIRVDRGDAYSLDVSLARIVLPLLKLLQRDKQGIPSDFISNRHGRQLSFEFIDEMADDEEERAKAIWDRTVDHMIFSFHEIAHGIYLGSDLAMSEHERNAYYERVQNGLQLFAKHYFALWT